MKLRCALKSAGLALLLPVVWTTAVFHRATLEKPAASRLTVSPNARATWYDQEKFGIHQLIVEGNAYSRGTRAGEKTARLLSMQEDSLNTRLNELIPSRVLRGIGMIFLMRWYSGIENYFEPWALDEMYGVGEWAPHEYDHLADGFTRQAAYHGLHEVGQLMVDQGLEDMGCTVAAFPHAGTWVIGRNFDFEGGQVFDDEKIVKWVFPDIGFGFVSVIWAGMVGAVTGVYVSINAAGSSDFKRLGTPSTLLVTKALQNATSALEAVQIITKEQMFITDIFVVADRNSSQLYRVEKSPEKMAVLTYTEPIAIANHLDHEIWTGDKVNEYRKRELTTSYRARRGQEMLLDLSRMHAINPEMLNRRILAILRDKNAEGGKPLHLANRRAIDALIAAHSVIFNAPQNRLYVGTGPAVAGRFIGFDLAKSFEKREPVVADELPADLKVTREIFNSVKDSFRLLSRARKSLKKKDCAGAGDLIGQAEVRFNDSSIYFELLGDLRACKGELSDAPWAWKTALEKVPAYFRQEQALREKLK
ncbi:MAG: C45 family peptidase [Bdellovibrionia bacterium]